MPNMCAVNTSVPVSISASVNYRPQQSCGKVIFSQASVSHSVHRGGCLPQYMLGYTPRASTPPPPWAGKPPPGRYTPTMVTAVGDTHPTGMLYFLLPTLITVHNIVSAR